MSIHARKLPNELRTALGTIVEPDVQNDRAASTEDAASARAEPAGMSADRQRAGDVARSHPNARKKGTAVECPDLPWYRTERWLAVQLLALVPILAAMFAPIQFRVPLSIAGGTLVAIGTVMMLMHKPTSSLRDTGVDSSSA